MDAAAPVPDRSTFATAAWALRQIRAAAPVAFLGLIGLTLVQGVLPAGLALVLRELINEDCERRSLRDGQRSDPLPLALARPRARGPGCLELSVGGVPQPGIADDLNLHVTERILGTPGRWTSHPSRIPIARTCSPARRTTSRFKCRPLSTRGCPPRGTYDRRGLLVVLSLIEPLSVSCRSSVCDPVRRLPVEAREAALCGGASSAAKRRWTTYYIQKLTTADSVAELKILDLGPHMIDKSRALLEEFRNRDRILHRKSLSGGSMGALLTTAALYGLFVRVAVRTAHVVVGRPGGIRGGGRPPAWRLKPGDPFSCGIGASLCRQPTGVPLDRADRVLAGRGRRPLDRGEIEIRDPTFAYPGSSVPVLRNLSSPSPQARP